MLPSELTFHDVHFRLGPAKAVNPMPSLPRGTVFEGAFRLCSCHVVITQGCPGRRQSRVRQRKRLVLHRLNAAGDPAHPIKPGYIKRADLAWYCSHHHNAAGENVPYAYSYLFAYALDLPPEAHALILPNNDKIRILRRVEDPE